MAHRLTISPRIIEALYCEALVLSDDVRNVFSLSGRLDTARTDEDLARIALSSEGLRTTTRMMHAIAWLLNHRAYHMGEISAFQLRHHGRLSAEMRESDPRQFDLIDADVQDLIERTRRFYDRLLRLDRGWRQMPEPAQTSAIQRLRDRIERRLAV
ncbi:DUF1465 family protein [Novosphingobium colocasiae]|uniref:DUF1465 family protein n=1 Tax=Novosphingobium colocasiae TaxID=1256513 RepID=A0A918P9Y3_9SPHN|nr:DUF1465 family protein [Novosphingobium colocasiae]GGY94671.1 hypothetical protein GCM10011614_07180 [Novosphingobium colocasiae]